MLKNIVIFLVLGSLVFSSKISFADQQDVNNSQEQESNISALEVKNVWARASIPSSPNSAAYFEIANSSEQEFVLVSASTTVANNVELHNSFVDEKGISRMTTIDRVVVPAGSTIEFKPGGMHVMLFNLKKPLNQGDKFNLKLIIENSDPIDVECEVRN